MTAPTIPQRVSDFVRDLIPRMRYRMSAEEASLAVHLRTNESLYNSLVALITTRIAGRASVSEPTDPLLCKSMLARDRELQWLLSRLEFLRHAPIDPAQSGELPR